MPHRVPGAGSGHIPSVHGGHHCYCCLHSTSHLPGAFLNVLDSVAIAQAVGHCSVMSESHGKTAVVIPGQPEAHWFPCIPWSWMAVRRIVAWSDTIEGASACLLLSKINKPFLKLLICSLLFQVSPHSKESHHFPVEFVKISICAIRPTLCL